jgi:hypothetical protein
VSLLRWNKVAKPATPAGNKALLYYNTTDRKMKVVDDLAVESTLTPDDIKDNLIINGSFEFAQRQVAGTLTTYSNTTGRSFGADRWGMTNENASIQFQNVDTIGAAEASLNARFYGRFKKLTSAGKMIVSQVVQSSDMAAVRGRTVRFSCKMKFSVAASMTVRMGILELSSAGTFDTMPATFASAFGAVGTDPTWGTNLALKAPVLVEGGSISGLAMTCVLTSGWVRYSMTVTLTSSSKNIIPVIWTNGQPAANDELNIAEVSLTDGEEIMDWTPRLSSDELDKCLPFYQKTFPLATAPAQSAGVNGALRDCVAIAGAVATSSTMQWRFNKPMRAAPTLVFFNPSAANAFVRNVPAATDATVTAAAGTTADCVDINATGLAAWAVGQELKVHATADAEI